MKELDFEDVKPGMELYDHTRDDRCVGTVLAKGKLKELSEYDDEGIIEDLIAEDEDYADADAVAFAAEVGKYDTAVTTYGMWGWSYCKPEDLKESRYQPSSFHDSWDDVKEDYLLWQDEQRRNDPHYDDIVYEDSIDWLITGIKKYKIMPDFDENTRVKYWKRIGNDVKLYTKDHALAAVLTMSDEKYEDWRYIVGYEMKEITK